MTQDDVIKITRLLGICELTSKPKQAIHYSLTIHEMLDVFKLVAAREREACAKVAETPVGEYEVFVVCEDELPLRRIPRYMDSESIAKAIRARGEA